MSKKQGFEIKVKNLKERNFLVVLAIKRKAGKHKDKRKNEKRKHKQIHSDVWVD